VITALSLLCLVAFVLIERMVKRPMIDFSVFRIRPFSCSLLGSACMNVSFWPFMIYLPVYFQDVLGYWDVVAGGFMLSYK
ncbi:MFS transporter, partial [Salmonella enterica subsp. enterica serovar Give]|nr:MFS transporter [Salmonella enterica subsp. enterica serovar Give]